MLIYFLRELILKMFGETLTDTLINSNEEKDLYVVMEFLRPIAHDNYIISSKSQKDNKKLLHKLPITNELGIYGTLIR